MAFIPRAAWYKSLHDGGLLKRSMEKINE